MLLRFSLQADQFQAASLSKRHLFSIEKLRILLPSNQSDDSVNGSKLDVSLALK